ncbi:zinc-dependent metalloprotease [Myxococcus sp. RHSTA-1-4]|uniref:zinc-dependent metalloprotease n=1 Tax=Myxococcus sp. RHSTA-1-4 TaxID=2874601 RepID=UPI001CBD8D40|nr:zinc-dependent metalloprotease [Myxococcus sp. RHSTA-1-4]MBZ4418604.1 zinc-dependent metalloprotease [Myxococcus sp. RHSTA-1-4]
MRWQSPLRRSWLGAVSTAVALGIGCGPADTPAPQPETQVPAETLQVELDDAFVAIPRTVSAEQQARLKQKLDGVVSNTGESFYLAIRKSELGQRWFLSAYLKQAFPGAVFYGAASSLGTRVVSFKEQNGKLFVFDVDDRKTTSDVFDPQVLVEAWPIVNDYGPFNSLRGSNSYILVDPTAGLNRFALIGEAYGQSGLRFEVELNFAQRFRRISDGITFEQVITGYADVPDPSAPDYLEDNLLRQSGTLGVALRRYQEGAGYTPTPLPPREHYFRSEPLLVPNTGQVVQTAAKWNIHPGMKPIKWHITDTVNAVQADPRFKDYDVVGAVRKGVENWNEAFGFKVFEAAVGDTVGFADDDKNVIIFDPDASAGFAFADWRTNPNTGEIRGASVYVNALWLEYADGEFGDDAAAALKAKLKDARKPLRMAWSGLEGEPLCELALPPLREGAEARHQKLPGPARDALLTKKQKVEQYLTHVIAHEVGHTLGLRHNFAGSLVFDGNPASPRSSSVMEYVYDPDAIYLDKPASYDVQAVRYLYGLSETLPTGPFCTDPDTRTEPYCNRFDRYSDPLGFFYGPTHQLVMELLLYEVLPFPVLEGAFDYYANATLQWVRAGVPADQTFAYDVAIGQVRPPLAMPPDAGPLYGEVADDLARRILSRLYLDPASQRDAFTATPGEDNAATPAVLADIQGILLNVDGIRSFKSRRTMVDILKSMQSLPAYLALRDARDTLSAGLGSLSGVERAQAEDLLARVQAALSPYYQ